MINPYRYFTSSLTNENLFEDFKPFYNSLSEFLTSLETIGILPQCHRCIDKHWHACKNDWTSISIVGKPLSSISLVQLIARRFMLSPRSFHAACFIVYCITAITSEEIRYRNPIRNVWHAYRRLARGSGLICEQNLGQKEHEMTDVVSSKNRTWGLWKCAVL